MAKRDAMIANAADPEQLEVANAKINRRDEEEREDLRWLLAAPQGRRIAWRLLSWCSVYRSIFAPDATIYYNAGQQDIGHRLQDELLKANTNGYTQMVLEHQELANA